MLAEFLKALSDKIDQTRRPTPISIQGMPPDRVLLAMNDGEIKTLIIPEGPTCLRCHDLDSLVRATLTMGSPMIWYDHESVCGYNYHENPEEGLLPNSIEMELTPLPKWELVKTLASQTYNADKFVRLLRIELARSVPPGFVDAVRKTLFQSKAESEAQIDRTRSSMGKSVTHELKSQNPIPEEITLDVRIYQELGYSAPIVCAVEIDLVAQKFALIPLPEEIEQAQWAAMRHLESELQGLLTGVADCPIYYGSNVTDN